MQHYFRNIFSSARIDDTTEKLYYSFMMLSVLMLILSSIALSSTQEEAYIVNLDGEALGAVGEESIEKIEEYVKEYKEKEASRMPYDSIEYKTEISFEKTDKELLEEKYQEKLYYEKDELEILVEDIIYNMYYLAQGYGIEIDGEEYVVLKDKDTAEDVLEEVKSAYLEDYEKEENIKINEVIIKEDVSIASKLVPPEEVKGKSEAKEYLLKGEEKIATHEVKEGESLSEIAKSNDTTVENLRKANFNPEASKENDEDEIIRPGDKLQLEKRERLFSIVASMEVTEENKISYDTKYRSDDSLWQEEREVIEEGKTGKKEITYKVVKENGQELEREKKEERIIKEPKPKIVAEGTAIRPGNIGGEGHFIWPIASSSGRVTSPYGMRNGSFHSGVDYAVPEGTPIRAAENGRVAFSGNRGNYGNLIIIEHTGGYETYYAHNSVNYVSTGQRVEQGQTIGLVGNTGRATGSHLHFELHRNGSHVNPLKYFNP